MDQTAGRDGLFGVLEAQCDLIIFDQVCRWLMARFGRLGVLSFALREVGHGQG
jgi:hypothetical protein